MMNRRSLLSRLASTTALGLPLLQRQPVAAANLSLPGSQPSESATANGSFKRIVFFMQNQGFAPGTCIPKSMKHSGSLANAKLPEPIQDLEPLKDKLHIISGLHGRHTSPSHSAFFGALGGYRGGDGVPPSASTIDHELSKLLPQTLLPHLCLGMGSLENMRGKPTIATLSASGAGRPIFMHSNPNHLYSLLYGGISKGEIRRQHAARSRVMDQIEKLAIQETAKLPLQQKQRFGQFVREFQEINGLRLGLDAISDHLRKFAPVVDQRYSQPEFETDWHDVLLELGISALQSGITNTLTIGSGRGEIFGSWHGIGVDKQGHNLGHMEQVNNPIWIKIRQYNCRMLVRLVESLENVPEGNGTMMDNTLIVYTSNNADKQHTNGDKWPVMLIGDCGGTFKTGCFTHVEGKRPINAFYTSLLRAAGSNVDRFNMSEKLAGSFDSKTGPLQEILS